MIVSCVRAGGGVLLFGNGGSAADAQHIAGELVGRFLRDRAPIKALALTTDSSILTSLANDSGYEGVFSRQVEALGAPGDVAAALSTSGDSPSVAAGLAAARRIGMKTLALTGEGGGRCAELADVLLDVPSRHTPRIQEAHAVIYHILCELVEAALAE
jgi:D-sedoheptulose 7-phosphate isomerase